MSDTPRTDSMARCHHGHCDAHTWPEALVAIQDARKLERDLYAARSETFTARATHLAIMRERDEARAVLQLIADHGGTTDDEGLACNGTWCAEQARTFLDTANDQTVVGSLSERILRRIFGDRYDANANEDAEMAVAHVMQQLDTARAQRDAAMNANDRKRLDVQAAVINYEKASRERDEARACLREACECYEADADRVEAHIRGNDPLGKWRKAAGLDK